jgi:predicted O-linked N-acetylglucosamine transferase (SPINDLY family)/nucleoside-diphosphate-sugar epimerase
MKRVLLTGASGFLGRQTIAPLLALGYEVHAVGNTVTDPRARWYRADLLDQTARRRLLAVARPQALLHCAWVTTPGRFWSAPENVDWVAASLDLASAAAGQGATRILVAGSCAEYDWSRPAPWREADPSHPATLYGIAKDSLHRLLAAAATPRAFSLVWPRLFHLYGPHEAPARLVPGLLASLHAGQRAATGPPDALRDFMHVADAGRALAHLLASDAEGPVNVASGAPVSIGDLATAAAHLAGASDLLDLGARPAAEPAVITADLARLRATGYAPEIPLAQGLAELWSKLGPPSRRPRPAPPPDYDRAARLYRAGQRDAAQAAALAVLAAEPDHPAALNLLGVLHRQRGELSAARACLERAAQCDPEHDTAWINLGNVALDLEDAPAAVAAYSRALAAAPGKAETLRLLGNALARAGRDGEALARFDAALAAAPAASPVAAGLLRDRGRAHFSAGRTDAALADLDAALAALPDDVDLLIARAQMLRLSGQPLPALALLQSLLARAPDHAELHLTLADALLAEEQREPANAHYRRTAELRPDDDQVQAKLCWSLLNSRYGSEAAHIAEAAAIARRLVGRPALHPAAAHPVQSALLRIADLDGLAAFDALFPDRAALLDFWVRRNVIGALHAQLGRVRNTADRLALVDSHRAWGTALESKLTPLRPQRGRRGARIRIGIVSSDLRHHPVSYFALPIFEHHDRDRFELFAYSFHPGAPDAVQQRIAACTAAFRRLPNLPDRTIAKRIAEDRLDILFELGGSTHLNRLEVMAHQPAPVQVSWLGYPHSSGLGRIGFILVDPYLKPPDPRLLLERPFEMPSSWVSLGPLGFADQPITDTLPEERAGRLTFGTMNNPYKYAPAAFALWARVLLRVPGSRFLFVRPEAGVPAFRAAVARAFARHGVPAERLAYAAVRGTHMARYNDIDIALDTLPQTGGTTTCESLWMGVPTVSLVGPAFYERLSHSNLVNAGLPDLAVHSPDAYVDAAVALALDRPRRRELRRTLRAGIRASRLGDTRGWVRDLEALTVRTLEHADDDVVPAAG